MSINAAAADDSQIIEHINTARAVSLCKAATERANTPVVAAMSFSLIFVSVLISLFFSAPFENGNAEEDTK